MKKIAIPAYIILAVALSACGSDFEWFPSDDNYPPTVTGEIDSIKFSNTTTIYPRIPSSVTLFGSDAQSEPVTLFYTTSGTYTTYTTPFVISDKSWNLTVYGRDNAGIESGKYTIKFGR